jgi:hypothetical protein
VPLPTPAAAAMSSIDTACSSPESANSASAAASTLDRGTGGRPRRAPSISDLRSGMVLG